MYWLRRLLLGIPSTLVAPRDSEFKFIEGTMTPLRVTPQAQHFTRHGNYSVKVSPAPGSMDPMLAYQSGIPTTSAQDSTVCLIASQASIADILNFTD